jgi:hypothetical protein
MPSRPSEHNPLLSYLGFLFMLIYQCSVTENGNFAPQYQLNLKPGILPVIPVSATFIHQTCRDEHKDLREGKRGTQNNKL